MECERNYLSKLLNDTDDFITVEHWLLPEHMHFLDSINPDFYAYGICVKNTYPLSRKTEPVEQDLEASQSCGERNYMYIQSNVNIPIV